MQEEIKMPFGKYKDKPMSEIPHGYLLYLYDRKKLKGRYKKFAEENIPVLRYGAKPK